MFAYYIRKLWLFIRHPGSLMFPHAYSQSAYLKYLKDNGVKIGENTRFIAPSRCNIDPGRMDYIEIGKNCCLSEVSILAHDYSWYTLLESKGDLFPDSGGGVKIGDNCFIGYNALILKNTNIGDNVIIGARAVVKGNIPSNTVWAGVPAKQICTIEELYEKRKNNRLKDAYYRRDHIRKVKGRDPYINEMGYFGYLFLERTEDNYNKYFRDLEHNGIKDSPIVRNFFFSSKPMFSSFDEFLSKS